MTTSISERPAMEVLSVYKDLNPLLSKGLENPIDIVFATMLF